MFEGVPTYPQPDRFWKIVDDYKVSIFYTAPTAIRALIRLGDEWPNKHDLSSIRVLGTVGEPINPEAWLWYHRVIGKEKCPIVDTWWQTETGAIMVTPLPGLTTTKPGSATVAFPGIQAEVLTEAGEPVKKGGGYIAITKPWPSMLRTLYGDDARYVKTYWSQWGKKIYFPGDGVKLDKDKYFWFLGRVDDVMNVAGHRIGTMEVESALVSHDKVAEAAAVGVAHDVKGQAVVAFVTPKGTAEPGPELKDELRAHVAKVIGAFAKPEHIRFTDVLPKTRSGKIMRRILRKIAANDYQNLGDTSTLAEPEVVQHLIDQRMNR